MDVPDLADQQGIWYISLVWTQEANLGTCQKRDMIVTDSKREPGNFLFSGRFDHTHTALTTLENIQRSQKKK